MARKLKKLPSILEYESEGRFSGKPFRHATITGRDDVFTELICVLSEKFGNQWYLKAIRDRMVDAGIGGERLRIVKRAIW